jgi:hypothetical protein
MAVSTHKDDSPIAFGVHSGATGLNLINKLGYFKTCGITVGRAIYNTTDGSNGLITAVTDTTITCTLSDGINNEWTDGDAYEIYITGVKGATISQIEVDKRYGRKTSKYHRLNKDGYFKDDVDEPDGVFTAGQPIRMR